MFLSIMWDAHVQAVISPTIKKPEAAFLKCQTTSHTSQYMDVAAVRRDMPK